ncbi:MAG: glycosyltransferase family 2 protein, partial [Actinomycetota bacterium]|nr:glycosyltransferase family 2 protein [Actinomycetota bacterium]
MPRVAVIVPSYEAQAFLPRALDSLLAQTYDDWEAVLVDDGSPTPVADVAKPWLEDPRIRLEQLPDNTGLGRALNVGLDASSAPYVTYLPADDVLHADHLASLAAALDAEPGAVLAISGVRQSYNRYADGRIPGEPIQLVQAMHRRTADRWVERAELVTDDLDRMFWSCLLERGSLVETAAVTCEWVAHPGQLSKVLREPVGGLNNYRSRFRVAEPIRMHTTVGNRIDEVEHYRRFRSRPSTPPAPGGLKILLVGELAYNAERVLALEERGHTLYGLWMPDPYWYNTVGPVPFGHVRDLPREGWREAIRGEGIDVIYGLLNWQAVPFAASVLRADTGVPFVWHYKEGPFIDLEKGSWGDLVELYTRSDGQIYSSPEMRAWFGTSVPATADGLAHVLDGDLPKREWFVADRSPLLSDSDGEVHTVVPGRPIGLHPHTVEALATEGVHLHFYGDFTHRQWRQWIEKSRSLAPRHLHLHAQVDQGEWVREFSQYDAGWLHTFSSRNRGDLRRADWDDLNYPARLTTLVAAGVPLIQRDNTGSVVATQSLVRSRGLGVFYRELPDL